MNSHFAFEFRIEAKEEEVEKLFYGPFKLKQSVVSKEDLYRLPIDLQ